MLEQCLVKAVVANSAERNWRDGAAWVFRDSDRGIDAYEA